MFHGQCSLAVWACLGFVQVPGSRGRAHLIKLQEGGPRVRLDVAGRVLCTLVRTLQAVGAIVGARSQASQGSGQSRSGRYDRALERRPAIRCQRLPDNQVLRKRQEEANRL